MSVKSGTVYNQIQVDSEPSNYSASYNPRNLKLINLIKGQILRISKDYAVGSESQLSICEVNVIGGTCFYVEIIFFVTCSEAFISLCNYFLLQSFSSGGFFPL